MDAGCWSSDARSRKRSSDSTAFCCLRKFGTRCRLEENNRLASRCAQVESKVTGNGRQQAELAARERLLKDEFERKTQEIRLEMNKERRQLLEYVEKLKQDLAGCFCRQQPSERVELAGKRRLS